MGRMKSVVASVVASALVMVGFGFAGDAAAAPVPVPSSVETVPGSHSGDSIDDPAIWVDPTDPSRSLVIANDKLGALDVYNLDGTLHQRITDPAATFYGNVDLRRALTVGTTTRDVVAVTHRGIQFFTVNPATRQLQPITEGTAVGVSSEGLCLYRSALTGKAYVINISIQGRLRQYELTDADGDGLIDVSLVRDFEVGSEAEGCVADDDTGALFVSEEDVALWKYDAEPTGGTARIAVDRTVAAGGNLQPDIEGVTLATLPGGGGYLIASAQNVSNPNNSFFAVYQRHRSARVGQDVPGHGRHVVRRLRPHRRRRSLRPRTSARTSRRDCSSARTTTTTARERRATRISSSCGSRPSST